MRRVIVAGPFPPPVNGFSYITQQMARALSERHQIITVNLAPGSHHGGIGYHLGRIGLAVRALGTLFMHRRDGDRVFYIACDGNLGLVYTIALCSAARALGYPLYLHHHSFGYIDRQSVLMKSLLSVTGQSATHIFLCDAMARRFASRYRKAIKGIVLSNSAFVAPSNPKRQRRRAGPLVIGLLSNLNEAKGLYVFLDVLRVARNQGLDIAAALAGPAQSVADAEAIAKAGREFGARLDYRGAVYGEAKEVFFDDIDVFLFPTRYSNEAQPTVIYEALSHGVPVISYDRGCICDQLEDNGVVVPRDEPFADRALEWLKARLNQRSGLSTSKEIRLRFKSAQERSREQLTKVFDGSHGEFEPECW